MLSLEQACAEPFLSAWANLTANAEEPNVFLEPWMLGPSAALLSADDARILAVSAEEGLIGLALVAPARGYARLPLRCLRSALHPHLFLATPLVAKGKTSKFSRAVCDWLNEAASEFGFVHFTHLDGEGPIAQALRQACADRGNFWAEVDRRERPMIVGRRSSESYLAEIAGSKRRKRLRRLRRRLEELGEVTFETFENGALSDPDEWLEDFLALEHRGWKGDAGTSILSNDAEAGYYRTIVRAASLRGQLLFSRLALDGKAIAYALDMRSGTGVFSLKTAYDDTYAKYSPGIQLELRLLDRYLTDPAIGWVDSCAAPGATQLDSLWSESRAVCQIVIGRSAWRAAPLVLATGLERGSAWLRNLLLRRERAA